MFKMRNYLAVRFVIFVAISILIGIFAKELIPNLHFLVGAVMLVYGFEGLFFPIIKEKKSFYREYRFYLGFMELLLGIVMMSAIRDAVTICVMWGTWTIVRESYELYETSHKFIHKFPAVFSLALSIIEVVFSILLIISASSHYEHHALTHIYLLIPELIINGISPLLFDYFQLYIKKNNSHNLDK